MPIPESIPAPVKVFKQPLVQQKSMGIARALPAISVSQLKAKDDEETVQRKSAPKQIKNTPVYTGVAQGLPAIPPFPIQKKKRTKPVCPII